MSEMFNNEMITLLALFTTLLATLILIFVGRKALQYSKEASCLILDEMIKDRKGRLGEKVNWRLRLKFSIKNVMS